MSVRANLACENSRPSSLPAEWRFARLAKRHSAGSEEGRLFSKARANFMDILIFLPGMRDKSMRSGTELARVHEKVTFTVCMFIFICI